MPSIPWQLARFHRRTFARRTRVVAVVGSFGKTTTTRAIACALGLPERLGRFGWNDDVALADNILQMRPRDKHAVLEVAIVTAGQMGRFAHLVRPNIAVVTSIGSEHLSSLGSLEVTRNEKAEMVRSLPASGLAVLNGDDPNVLWMRDASPAPVLTYGFGSSNDVRATRIRQDSVDQTRFRVLVAGKTHEVRTRLLGRHMVYPLLASVAVCQAVGRSLQLALEALERLEPTPNRVQPIRLPGGAILLLDAYKSGLETIHAALDVLEELPARRKMVVFGEVEEPPGSQGPIYKDLGKRIGRLAESVIFVGARTSFKSLRGGAAMAGMPAHSWTHVRESAAEVAQELSSVLGDGDLALIKGRSGRHLERIALLLQGVPVDCAVPICQRRHSCTVCPLLQCRP